MGPVGDCCDLWGRSKITAISQCCYPKVHTVTVLVTRYTVLQYFHSGVAGLKILYFKFIVSNTAWSWFSYILKLDHKSCIQSLWCMCELDCLHPHTPILAKGGYVYPHYMGLISDSVIGAHTLGKLKGPWVETCLPKSMDVCYSWKTIIKWSLCNMTHLKDL